MTAGAAVRPGRRVRSPNLWWIRTPESDGVERAGDGTTGHHGHQGQSRVLERGAPELNVAECDVHGGARGVRLPAGPERVGKSALRFSETHLLAQGEVLESELAVAAVEEREESKQAEQRADRRGRTLGWMGRRRGGRPVNEPAPRAHD
jgi:hypothetical protein